MKRFTFIALTLALANTGTAVAVTDKQLDQPSSPNFEMFDIDKNGEISTHEAVQDALLQSVFKDIDRNGDHKLSKDEYQSYKEAQEKKPG